jgi:AcrR family transcriptional regulator
MNKDPAGTRRRIIEAADALFYGEGVRSASVDAIAARAGVTKRTLYYHFTSKDDLIAAYLEARDAPTLGRYRAWFESAPGTFGERIAGVFAQLARYAANPRWKGCGFARAAAELAGLPGHPAIAAASRHKHAFEAWLADLLAAEDIADHRLVARQLMVLLDGAITHILIHRDPDYAIAAGQAAASLVHAARRAKTSRPHAPNVMTAQQVAAR